MRRPSAAAAAIVAALTLLAGCTAGEEAREAALLTSGGDPVKGRALIRAYGCGSCHTIPGIRGANSLVGPPLIGIPYRTYIAGVITNEPDNLARWIQNPQAIDSLTAMPNLGVSPAQARDIAAYLYTLR
jgi:cytochrome c